MILYLQLKIVSNYLSNPIDLVFFLAFMSLLLWLWASLPLSNNIGTFTNSSGIQFSSGSGILNNAVIDRSATGAGTSGDPYVYTYAYEFSDAEFNEDYLPDLSADKEITCYMSSNIIDYSVVSGTDLDTVSEVAPPVTVAFQTASPTNPANNDTSSAKDLVGLRSMLALLAWFNFMALH